MLLGIDTGGTYTDAVVYDEVAGVVLAKAKSPTTHHDLAIGICAAIDAVLHAAAVQPQRIELVSLSTTLATNALVEGKGRSVCAVIIGFDGDVLERAGLGEALGNDPVIILPGGHDPHGSAIAPFDGDRLAGEIEAVAQRVEAFAVTAQFSVRNPEHELAAAEVIRTLTGKPVTLSHHLSARLNGPKRAVTAVLNARLISIIDGLVRTTESALVDRGVRAPLMVVRGDGSLVSAAFVRERPIETILSGPAASLVGAAHLTGLTDAVIADIGGTTTDIAVLRDGVPIVSADGATVGGHQTMVSAVAMHTHGLGGDSHVRHDERAAGAVLLVGPRRVVPICQLAMQEPALVHAMLDQQLTGQMPGDLDGMLLIAEHYEQQLAALAGVEHAVLAAMGGRVAVAATALSTMQQRRVMERLVQRGALQLAAFTPTDAAHVLGLQANYDAVAATKAAELFARKRDRLGKALAANGTEVAQLAIDTLVRRSAEAVLAAAFVHDGLPADIVRQPVVQAALDRRYNVLTVSFGLHAPLVGLGASAAAYYPMVAALLGVEPLVPAHADVANAVGAVVGRVRLAHECVISAPQQGQYLVHVAGEVPAMFTDLAAATSFARQHLLAAIAGDMVAAGAPVFETNEHWHEQTVDLGGLQLFVEGVLTLSASGRPELAR
ncbi:MAG TPA: hydantoinase/oxoprolinase family protein [Ilumatobacteraceae bacterium]|nr:hydantoinase/oxoprolinase family protein [Ilumatobacteraceae bacterium]